MRKLYFLLNNIHIISTVFWVENRYLWLCLSLVLSLSEGGASSNPCSDTFAGSYAFSEIETRTLSEYYSTIASKISTYISFHSFGQMLLVPFGHTTAHLGNYYDLIAIGQKSLAKLKERYGTAYTLGNIAETICKLFPSYWLWLVSIKYKYLIRRHRQWRKHRLD